MIETRTKKGKAVKFLPPEEFVKEMYHWFLKYGFTSPSKDDIRSDLKRLLNGEPYGIWGGFMVDRIIIDPEKKYDI
jgi:hypothetical protein